MRKLDIPAGAFTGVMGESDVLYKRAVEIATRAHAGQVDKGGHPYIGHPLAVADSVEGMAQKIVAVLHDILEDTSVTADDLRAEGFPRAIVEAVEALTRQKSDPISYEAYLCRVKQNPLARAVKMADLRHNLDLTRIPCPTPRDYKRMEKYQRALRFLSQTE